MFSSYRNQSIDLPCKSVDWFLYGRSFGLVSKLLRANYPIRHQARRNYSWNEILDFFHHTLQCFKKCCKRCKRSSPNFTFNIKRI